MDNEKLKERLGSLTREFKNSGMDIDAFVKAKLSAVRKDGAECAEKISETMSAIDTRYAELQAAKERGVNRREWMVGQFEAVAAESSAENAREKIGGMLAEALDALNGKDEKDEKSPEEVRSFDGPERIEIVREIDDALTLQQGLAFGMGDANKEVE